MKIGQHTLALLFIAALAIFGAGAHVRESELLTMWTINLAISTLTLGIGVLFTGRIWGVNDRKQMVFGTTVAVLAYFFAGYFVSMLI